MWRIEIRNIATVTCDVEIAIDHENLPETQTLGHQTREGDPTRKMRDQRW
jgi:hypothetical protein